MADKLSREQLEDILSDLKDEPSWRARANNEADFYDGLQLDATTLSVMDERNQPPLIRNLIGPTIDLVLGMEAKNKRDWKIAAESDVDFDMSLALSALMKKHERTSGADRACSDAYDDQTKIGLGWVEIARNHDPLGAPYRIRRVNWREIYWDWRAQEPNLSDIRYLVRHRWLDLDVAKLYFPGKAKTLDETGRAWAGWDLGYDDTSDNETLSDFTAFRDTGLALREWMDYGASRVRIRLSEVWYRHYQRRRLLRLTNLDPASDADVAVVLDSNNAMHAALLRAGLATVEESVVPMPRLTWWAGPIRLADLPSPYPHNDFPYVPFFGFRESRTGAPYGLIRRMVSPQMEVNARLSRMMWLLSAKRIIADSDASERPWSEVLEQASRPDAVILLDPNRRNKNMDALRVESDFQLSQQQFQVLKDATQAIQDAAGVYQSMLGKAVPGADSGVAINSLVEQGATTLANLNDNYIDARVKVGELLLSLIVADMGQRERKVSYDFAGERRSFVFNQRTEAGEITNQVPQLMLKVALQDTPDTPTYRAQQFKNLTEVLKSLPPEMQVAVAHIVIRASDLPQKEEMAQLIAQVSGQGGASPEQNATAAQQQQLVDMQNQLMMQQQQMALLEQQAKAEKLKAEADKIRQGMILDQDRLALDRDRHSLEITDRVLNVEKAAGEREANLQGKAMDAQMKFADSERQRQADAEIKKFEVKNQPKPVSSGLAGRRNPPARKPTR